MPRAALKTPPVVEEAAPAARRGIGRPSQSKPGVGREALIAATCDLLAKFPTHEVTRALVARTTNVDPSLIRYYFRDRSSLLVAAAERLTEEYARMLQKALAGSDGTATHRLGIRLTTLIEFNARYPFFHHLLYNEILHSNADSAKVMINELNQRALGGYAEILKDGEASGETRPVDPELTFVALITMSSFYTPLLGLLGIANDGDKAPAEFIERYKAFLLEFIIHGIGQHAPTKPKARAKLKA